MDKSVILLVMIVILVLLSFASGLQVIDLMIYFIIGWGIGHLDNFVDMEEEN